MSRPPSNALVVIIDALRADRVGACGEQFELTPNIDELAEEATAFSNAFACTNATDPSVTSLHTGRDPMAVSTHHGPLVSPEEKNRLNGVPVLPEILSRSGYRTYATGRALGRWHRRGFDSCPGESIDRDTRRRLGEALQRVSPTLRSTVGSVYEKAKSFSGQVRAQDGIEEMLSHIDSGDGPFYGYVHLMDTHVPYEPDPELVEQLLEERTYPNLAFSTFFDENDGPYYSEFLRDSLTERDFEVGLARLFAKYDAAVVEADTKVGRLVKRLKRRGIFEDTVLVVASDHGESLDEHGIYFDHHGLYDETIRVPLVVRTPDSGGAVCDEPVMLKDVPHTLLALLETGETLGGTGRSFASLVSEAQKTWEPRESLVFGEAHAQRRVAIRTRDAKYLKHVPDSVLEAERGSSTRCGYCDTLHETEALFDLEADPDEVENMVGKRPTDARELEQRLDEYIGSLEVVSGDGHDSEFDDDDEVLNRLEDLGYV
jgi:arylsulfatase A-like enzyme